MAPFFAFAWSNFLGAPPQAAALPPRPLLCRAAPGPDGQPALKHPGSRLMYKLGHFLKLAKKLIFVLQLNTDYA